MKVGQLMECDFGDYTYDANGNRMHNVDGHIAPEMVKNRLAVILNTKLNGGALVVPISSSQDTQSFQKGLHVFVDSKYVTRTHFYDQRDRWALCDHVRLVAKPRLRTVRSAKGYVRDILPYDVVAAIQLGVLTAINGRSLLHSGEVAPHASRTGPAVTQAPLSTCGAVDNIA